ncbi:hypothetical protein QOZ80_9AG0692490 [Eleusine coracana subsp. coracana]|nr:hypothetical protein QOZ80_9AG0692490 [Eleusine coracana subsp. coracana]
MAKRKLKLLAQRLFSTMLSLLLHAPPPISSSSSSSKPTSAAATVAPAVQQRDGCPPSETTTKQQTLVVDVDSALLLQPGGAGDKDNMNSNAVDLYFPYFMLVAMEAGGFLRGLLLLLLYPFLRLLVGIGIGGPSSSSSSSSSATTTMMTFVAFCGLRAARFRAGRAVLPKWFMEALPAEAFEAAVVKGGGRRRVVCVSRGFPRVMVDGFLREYLGADVVVAREMHTICGFYTGLIMPHVDAHDADHHREMVVDKDDAVVLGFSAASSSSAAEAPEEFLNHPLARCCKEVYVVRPEEKRHWRPLPRDKYPKPMVFHDGRLAFLPTAASTLAMFLYLPLGVLLGAARLAVALTLPYRYSTPLLAATGMSWRLKSPPPFPSSSSISGGAIRRGQLFVCNHRTLIDPVYVSVALNHPVRAVSYSLSRLSELISPIGRTVRLARDRARDGAAMATLLAAGDLVVVCPEGTTCREPYLLRFSPLFAELSDDVVPVGIAVETSMFYATTAGGLKCFDPLYYMVNPRMCYTVQFLEKVDTKEVRDGRVPSTEMANVVQRKMGEALGYGCTMLTRKDKYLILAGNDGVVVANGNNNDNNKSCSSTPAGDDAGEDAPAAGKKMKKDN